jgi:hypothetical protein
MSNGGTLNGVLYSEKNGFSAAGASVVLEQDGKINPITISNMISITKIFFLLMTFNRFLFIVLPPLAIYRKYQN